MYGICYRMSAYLAVAVNSYHTWIELEPEFDVHASSRLRFLIKNQKKGVGKTMRDYANARSSRDFEPQHLDLKTIIRRSRSIDVLEFNIAR